MDQGKRVTFVIWRSPLHHRPMGLTYACRQCVDQIPTFVHVFPSPLSLEDDSFYHQTRELATEQSSLSREGIWPTICSSGLMSWAYMLGLIYRVEESSCQQFINTITQGTPEEFVLLLGWKECG